MRSGHVHRSKLVLCCNGWEWFRKFSFWENKTGQEVQDEAGEGPSPIVDL